MAWEWLAPMGTVVGTLITAGLGGWVGGRYSGRTQQRQHQYERETSVLTRGRDKADVAITALRVLQEYVATIARWHRPPNDPNDPDDVARSRAAHGRLGGAIEHLTVPAVRRQIELIHLVIGQSALVTRYGRTSFDDPEMMILVACQEGVAILGRYLRDEPAQEPSPAVETLRQALNNTRATFRPHLPESKPSEDRTEASA